ncbi:cytochrome P450 [Colletotrichum eremochloae]|nr:cytochrome P450 [Colletotrichum eremochloae]
MNSSGTTFDSTTLNPTWVSRLGWHVIVALVVAYGASLLLYNLYFHPLAEYPGPWLGRASLLWRFIHTSTGRIHIDIEKLHRKYGPVVRVSPNELSFGSTESWKAVYGHSNAERPTPVKAPFYEIFGAGFKSLCIGSERDPKRHGEMRKMLSSAFSQRSLLDQEHIVSQKIDDFVTIIGQRAGPGSEGINMTKWYEMVSFDILGEMAFGESFHSLEDGKPHFWSDMIEEHLYFITLIDNLSRLGIARLLKTLIPSMLLVQNKNSQYSREKVDKILEHENPRKDFISLLVDRVREGTVDKEEMTAHVSTLTVAGGETVSTFLAGTTSFLLKHPHTLSRVQEEIRSAFPSYESINAQKAQQLPYLQAVIHEGLRLYPPGSQGFPRVSPGFQIHGRYVPAGTEIYTSAWAVTHDPDNFSDPMSFKPERWLDPDSKDVKEASQPFSLGPRGCLGRNFAYMEVNLILAKMLHKYDLELVNKDVDFIGAGRVFVMWWKPTLTVKFHERSAL